MATNTLGGVNLAKIAQKSLDAITTQLIGLQALTLDFSDEIKSEGDSVTTRVATSPTVKSASTTRSSDNSTLTAKTVTLNKFQMFDIGFKDLEIAKSSVKLENLFIKPGVVALVEDMYATMFALCLNANFPLNKIYTSSQYDADAAVDLATYMSTNKIPSGPRTVIVPPSYYGNLAKDNAVQAAYAFGNNDAIINRQVKRVAGLDHMEFNGTIPGNSENLVGFAAGPQAILMAARFPAMPEQWYGLVENVVEPVTGLPIQFRYFYDGNEQRLQAIILYGMAVGQATNGVRILSA
ncbi:MAG: hypothetical protein JWM68_2518 [Verrucomicrobiales bacterium]|nr:hypothetical protein [Verrucomicrobiales bacterium]